MEFLAIHARSGWRALHRCGSVLSDTPRRDHPEIILAGRRLNDEVGKRIGRECLRLILKGGKLPEKVTVLGLTFKENVPDIRNSKVVDIIREFQSFVWMSRSMIRSPMLKRLDGSMA